MLNLVDRALMILLLQPIKEDLKLSDTKLGFLTGVAFGLFYAVLGIPIARWADRGNRVTISSFAIGLWGLTVMACLFVTNYTQLAFARIAAAIGECGCKPPTYSLVGDYFPKSAERTRALAIYQTGGPLAALVSFVVGGWLNEIYGWRMTFFLMGLPGLILAALVKATITEPRAKAAKVDAADSRRVSIRAVLRTLWCQRSARHLGIALILLYAMGYGLAPWYAAFMMRSHGMATVELGVWLGMTFSVGGIVGALLGGYTAARWFSDDARAQMRLSAITVSLIAPCLLAFLILQHKYEALLALVPLTMMCNLFVGPTYAFMQRLVPDEMRATTMAVVMLFANLIGMGAGPQIVGVLSDVLFPVWGNDSLRYAMLLMSLVAVWAGCHFWRAASVIDEDLSNSAFQSSVGAPEAAELRYVRSDDGLSR